MRYLRGSIKAHAKDDPKYDDLFFKDQRIKSWLLSAMKPKIMKRYIRLSTSKDIWDALKTNYFDENDEARIYSLNQKASCLKQNGRSLASYSGELIEIFQELDHFNKVAMACEKDVLIFQKTTKRKKLYLFFGGLDDGFDQVRREILLKDPPLGLQAAYVYVYHEANRKEDVKMEGQRSELAAMAAKARDPSNRTDRGRSENKSGQPRTGQPGNDCPQGKCPHYGITGHSKSRCFELIRYPEN
ncbi:uncharacterized protein [Malus domestica]|uniref:uncharacterized protein n=1 Tax=Malus domestica TaxID=3750 RepID=UPI003974EEAF